jgi:hypothetical protein
MPVDGRDWFTFEKIYRGPRHSFLGSRTSKAAAISRLNIKHRFGTRRNHHQHLPIMFTLNPGAGGGGGAGGMGGSADRSADRQEQLWNFGQLAVYFGLLRGVYLVFAYREGAAAAAAAMREK